MRDPLLPDPPPPDGRWSPAETVLNQTAHEYAERVARMRITGSQLAEWARYAVNVERLSVNRVANLIGIDEDLVLIIIGDAVAHRS